MIILKGVLRVVVLFWGRLETGIAESVFFC